MKVLIFTMPFAGRINIFPSVARAQSCVGTPSTDCPGRECNLPLKPSGTTFASYAPACSVILDSLPARDCETSSRFLAAISILRHIFVNPVPILVALYREIRCEFTVDLPVDVLSLVAHTLRDLGQWTAAVVM
jgi:hypothetical protein